MASKPQVRPKSSRPTSSLSRPYSVSKDEAYARALQDEEYTAALNDDEEFARQLQTDLNVEERSKMMSSVGPGRPGLRAMTPISQLMSNLVHQRQEFFGQRRPFPPLALRDTFTPPTMSDDSSTDSDSDSDGHLTPIFNTTHRSQIQQTTSLPSPVPTTTTTTANTQTRGRARGRGSLHGVRPLETDVHVTNTGLTRAGSNSRENMLSQPNSRRTRRGRGGVVGARRGSRNTTQHSRSGEQVSSQPTQRRAVPATMEPSEIPLSLAINQPELPSGEREPEALILSQNTGAHEDGFLHIMRDPILLLLFLMGRSPQLLVPDDIDPTDYEALWDLAERIGEVKNRGLEEKDLKTLPVKKFLPNLKKHNEQEDQCRICLTEYKTGEDTCNLSCKHLFHANCIKEWLKRNASCPICRKDVKKERK